jgi:transcriptional regulator with XRE-family HTH domain
MEEMNAAKVVKKVRQRLEVSQEGLARLLNATKGAVQHWERGRNRPDLARLLALRQLCPAGAERKELETLIKETQAHVAPLRTGREDYSTPAGRKPDPVAPGQQ